MILNKSAYMDDETWVSVVQAMAPGIRQMPVIRDHPDWELLLTLDGFKSHVNVQETMTIWSQHKIRIAKEEAGTSHINQAYDQQQAKVDKQMARELLDKCRGKIRGNMDQYQLVAILIVGIRNLPSSAWVNSFKNVNLHPKHRISFKKWCTKIHQHLQTGEAAYTRVDRGMYDAMPGFWKNLDIETRQKVLQRIDEMYKTAGNNDIWDSKTNLVRLAEMVPLKLIPALRICHQVAKTDPGVIVGSTERRSANKDDENVISEAKEAANVPLQTFMLLPPNLLKDTKEAVTATEKISANLRLYKHVISFRNRNNHELEK